MKEFLDNLRGNVKETEGYLIFIMDKMLKEKDGWALLDLLEIGEWRVVENLGLVNGYIKEGVVYFNIPRWNNLVEHLRIVNSV